MNYFKESIISFIRSLHCGVDGVYKNCINGEVTLYASCFAVMCYHYLGELDNFDNSSLMKWGEYINNHQVSDGSYSSPEICNGALLNTGHSAEHLSWHLTCHVLPALELLNISPKKELSFIDKYLNIDTLDHWLLNRNWQEAWLEGNNLLFMGQLLSYIYVKNGNDSAKICLDRLFQYLDQKIDPSTGLWGTNYQTSLHNAAYGGYHQLLLYYYWNHDVPYKENLIDTVLSLQHFDGGFSQNWGGGSCEDVDCVDILVNLYKKIDYRRKDIEESLYRSAHAVLRRQANDGGFVYKRDEVFYHNGMANTYTPPNFSNMFSTWFGIHTIALISEIIEIPSFKNIDFNFNNFCSMGWHQKWHNEKKQIQTSIQIKYKLIDLLCGVYFFFRNIKRSSRILTSIYNYSK